MINAVLSQFKICCNLRVFSRQICIPKFQSSQKNCFFQVRVADKVYSFLSPGTSEELDFDKTILLLYSFHISHLAHSSQCAGAKPTNM